MIHRILQEQITSLLGNGKAIIIMGARQVGKSTLLETIFRHRENVLWMTGDDLAFPVLFQHGISDAQFGHKKTAATTPIEVATAVTY